MRYQFLVEAPGDPKETRFLNVLQGADAGAHSRRCGHVPGKRRRRVRRHGRRNDGDPLPGRSRRRGRRDPPTPSRRDDDPPDHRPHPGRRLRRHHRHTGDEIAVTVTAGTSYQADDGGVLLVGTLPDSSWDFLIRSHKHSIEAGDASTPETAEQETDVTDEPVDQGDDAGILPDVTVPALFGSDEADDDSRDEATVDGGDCRTKAEASTSADGDGQIVYGSRPTRRPRPGTSTASTQREGADRRRTSPWRSTTSTQSANDDWIGISPDGEWLLLGTERFDPDCAGWPCMAVVPADLSAGEPVRIRCRCVHPDGFGTIASGGDLIVYPRQRRSPHPRSLGRHPRRRHLERTSSANRGINFRLQPHRHLLRRRRRGSSSTAATCPTRRGRRHLRSLHRRVRLSHRPHPRRRPRWMRNRAAHSITPTTRPTATSSSSPAGAARSGVFPRAVRARARQRRLRRRQRAVRAGRRPHRLHLDRESRQRRHARPQNHDIQTAPTTSCPSPISQSKTSAAAAEAR